MIIGIAIIWECQPTKFVSIIKNPPVASAILNLFFFNNTLQINIKGDQELFELAIPLKTFLFG
jgi:hypothetical protein